MSTRVHTDASLEYANEDTSLSGSDLQGEYDEKGSYGEESGQEEVRMHDVAVSTFSFEQRIIATTTTARIQLHAHESSEITRMTP